MNYRRSSRPLWLLLTLAMALVCAALRRWQLATAFEGELNLAIPRAPASMALSCALVIAAAGLGIVSARQYVAPRPRGERGRGSWSRALSAPGDPIGLAVTALAAFLMLAAGPLLLWEGWSQWQAFRSGTQLTGNNGVLLMATGVCALAGFGGLLAAAACAYRGRQRGSGGVVLPALAGCLWLMELYRSRASDPVLWDYVPMLLAVVAGMLMYMDWGGLASGQPRPRRTLWLAGMTAVLSAVALAGQWQWGETLLLCAQLVSAFVVLSRLPVTLEHPTRASRVSVPEPEREGLLARQEDGQDQTQEDSAPQEPAQEIQEEETHE